MIHIPVVCEDLLHGRRGFRVGVKSLYRFPPGNMMEARKSAETLDTDRAFPYGAHPADNEHNVHPGGPKDARHPTKA